MGILERDVLVLNRNWLPVNVTTVRRAMVLLYVGAARAVKHSDFSTYDFSTWVKTRANGPVIKTAALDIPVPEVILLVRYSGRPPGFSAPSRSLIFARDNFTCQYCGRRFPTSQLTLDHVIPKALGGRDTWQNLVTACIFCNARKGNRTPRAAGMRLVRKPRRPLPAPLSKLRLVKNPPDSWKPFLTGFPLT